MANELNHVNFLLEEINDEIKNLTAPDYLLRGEDPVAIQHFLILWHDIASDVNVMTMNLLEFEGYEVGKATQEAPLKQE